MRFCFLVLLVVLSSTAFCRQKLPAKSSDTLYRYIKRDWKASWIGEEYPSKANSFYRFRYQFNISDLSQSEILASIATDSKYWLWINGKLVVFEGQLKRGPTPKDTYYDEIDIKPFLRKGKNTIALLNWYWGKEGFCHKSSGKAGLLFEAKVGKEFIASSGSWKTSKHKSYGNTGEPHPNYRLPESNIHYDARLDNEDWIKPKYDDSGWANANIIGLAGQSHWNVLWKRPFPQWFDSGLIQYENSFKGQEGKVVMKLPKNITITPYLKIEAPDGLLIDIRTDNYFGGSEPNVRAEYITKKGIQEFEALAYMNGHEVIYTFPAGVKILDLKYRETKYNTKHVGYFKSDNEFFNSLWQKCLNTMNVNMRDAIQDPDRERSQWWGDAVIILEEIFYSCDRNGIPAIQKAISNLLEWQKPDGVLFSPIPAGNWDKELPGQMLAAVGKYGIWKYIEYSGDTAMIRYAYPFIKKYMDLWQMDEKGLVIHRAGGWDWHDWADKIDAPLLDNAWYYMALEACYNMAVFLKHSDEAKLYRKKMQVIKENFQKYFWKGNRFVSDGYPHYADDRGNGLAVCAGLVSKEQWKKMKPVLDTIFHAGPYLEKYILESYFIMNDAASGLERMKKRYDKMVKSSLTTLWEGWGIGHEGFGGGSYNHGWSGGPLSIMSKFVAGISPTLIGYKSYSIIPQLSGLKQVSAGCLTARGFLSNSIIVEDDNVKMTVRTIDANGIIALPKIKNSYKKITVNNKKNHTGFKKIREDSDYIYYSCNSKGHWVLVAE